MAALQTSSRSYLSSGLLWTLLTMLSALIELVALCFPFPDSSVILPASALLPKYWRTAAAIGSDRLLIKSSTSSLFDIAAGGLIRFFASATKALRKAYNDS